MYIVMNNENKVSIEDVSSWVEIKQKNITLERVLQQTEDESAIESIKKQISDNEEFLKSSYPQSKEDLLSSMTYGYHINDDIKVKMFILKHPQSCEKFVGLPEVSEALPELEDKQFALGQVMKDIGNAFSNLNTPYTETPEQ